MLLLTAAITLVAAALAATPEPLPHGGSPADVPLETDCAIREFAWEYGRKLQPMPS